MFEIVKLQPGQLLQISWKLSSRTPISMISKLLFGGTTSEIYARIMFFRDVAGYIEDAYPIEMGDTAEVVEGDGMFVIGKRKYGVGRWHSKEHVYVCTESGSRKIRPIVVNDKSTDALLVFAPHNLPNTEMCVEPCLENSYFSNLDTVILLHQIPGPIHIDRNDPRKNTQTVETSHSGVKMRIRLERGLHRHNLQAVLDF